ncbi:MAG TPA: GyrI-like domain-containing protein [Methanoregula sp.]|nr:GyrI-like domain-containing protein [Methanoregula sp.]
MATDQIPLGRFSLITRLSQKALRLYDERGLLVPCSKDICTGYRYYTTAQIPRAVSIKTLCTLGFSPGETGDLLTARDRGDAETVRQFFEKRRGEIRSEVLRLQQIEALLVKQDAPLEVLYMSLSEPVIKELAPMRVIAKRGTGSYSETITRLLESLCRTVELPENVRAGLRVTGPVMTIYLDNEYKEKDADMECAIPITGKVAVNEEGTKTRTLPGGTCLSLVYKGSYNGLHQAWTRIQSYAEEKQYQIAGPGREVYYNDPALVPETELLTELQLLVERAGGE